VEGLRSSNLLIAEIANNAPKNFAEQFDACMAKGMSKAEIKMELITDLISISDQ